MTVKERFKALGYDYIDYEDHVTCQSKIDDETSSSTIIKMYKKELQVVVYRINFSRLNEMNHFKEELASIGIKEIECINAQLKEWEEKRKKELNGNSN